MIGTLGHPRIFLCTQDTDMRRSFDSLRGIIRSAMHLDPLTDCLFVFKNKRGDRIKVIYWDCDGFAMWYKVLQRGTFQFPDLANFSSAGIECDRLFHIAHDFGRDRPGQHTPTAEVSAQSPGPTTGTAVCASPFQLEAARRLSSKCIDPFFYITATLAVVFGRKTVLDSGVGVGKPHMVFGHSC